VAQFIQFALDKFPNRLTSDDVVQFAGALDNAGFYNAAALEIAKRYHGRELSYTFCDSVINDLWRAVLDGLKPLNNTIPEPFFEIYEAFDAGEFYRKPDKSDDPVAEFTDPAIEEVVKRFSL
jgi:hypothetical protein